MSVTRYDFSQAVSAFYEMPTELTRVLLPRHLQPLEAHHGSSIFAVTAFDFTESMVGPYQEIVLAVIVPPLIEPGGDFPKSAFYPFLLGTSTAESRAHAILDHQKSQPTINEDSVRWDGTSKARAVSAAS